MKKMLTKSILGSVLISISFFSHAQILLNEQQNNEVKQCTNFVNSYMKKNNVSMSESFKIQQVYLRECTITTSLKSLVLDNIDWEKQSVSEISNYLVPKMHQLNGKSIAIVTVKLFEKIHPRFLANKGHLSEEDIEPARKISLAAKRRIQEITIPADLLNSQSKYKSITLKPFLTPFKVSKNYFQKLDAILYDYKKSLIVIRALDDADTNEKKSQLSFDKEQCEISQTYIDMNLINSCKTN